MFRYKLQRIRQKPLLATTLFFWSIYWLFNFLDKFFGGEKVSFWVGKDRLTQLTSFFGEIGVTNPLVISGILILITLVEILAFYFYHKALINIFKGINPQKYFLKATVTSILLFSFFVAGDVVFGERGEVLEHTIYAVLALTSYLLLYPNKD